VTEEVYWQVWRQACASTGAGPVMAWLLTLARSRSLGSPRRGDEARPHAARDPGPGQRRCVGNPSHLLATAERDRDLLAALEQLEPLPGSSSVWPSTAAHA